MTRVEVAALSLRLAAIYIWLQAFHMLGNLSFLLAAPAEWPAGWEEYLLGWVVAGTLLAILGALLFLFAPAMARRMFDRSAPFRLEDRPEIGALGLQLAGVVLWDFALNEVSQVMFYARTTSFDPTGAAFRVALSVMLLFAAAGTCLFIWSPAIARRLFRTPAPEGSTPGIANLQAVAFSVIGLWIFATALPDVLGLVAAAVERVFRSSRDFDASFGLGRHWNDAFRDVSRAALGLVLFLGGGGFSGFWHVVRKSTHALQHAGLEPKNAQT